MSSEEKNYQKKFCDKYFGKSTWEQEVNCVDVVLKGKRGQNLLYIEFKYELRGEQARRQALAQTIITNKKQTHILDRVALAYRNESGHDKIEIIDCSDNSVMYNNDINWDAETASNPSPDAIDRINDRIRGKITTFTDNEIRDIYKTLRNGEGTQIEITDRNFNVVYNQWKNTIHFVRKEEDEQELINLFLTDILNGTKYELRTKTIISEPTLFGPIQTEVEQGTGLPLLREGTNLSKYELERYAGKIRIVYDNYIIHAIQNAEGYEAFWRKYKRPPEQQQYLNILEHSAELYTEKYRRDTGGEYTPTCFVNLQNQLLAQHHYNLNDYIVCDPCAGVGNLENQFGKEYKPYCYLSTLEKTDVDICQIKGFENSIRYDYLRSKEQPKWKYRGEMLDISDIAHREGRKLMVIMNPPYTRQRGYSNDLAIEFFDKVLSLQPDVIVYYCKTEFFLRDTVRHFVNSQYHVVAHVFSNAKDTFRLSEWAVSLVIFDRSQGELLDGKYIKAERYEKDKKDNKLVYAGTYTYDNMRPNLIKGIEKEIKNHQQGMVLGQWTNQNYCLVLSNRTDSDRCVTTGNLKYCLLLKGINFNTHGKYFETSNLTYRGTMAEIPEMLFSDAVMFSLFYKGLLFSNKGHKNYIMPFNAEELGCSINDLNVLFPAKSAEDDLFSQQAEEPFDFRRFLSQFNFSSEAKVLFDAALQLFLFYHHNDVYMNKDWNDSFYDITNAIMHKNVGDFHTLASTDDRRITRVKTTKGTHGFGRNTIADYVPEEDLSMFFNFFDARDTLAHKINRELLDAHLLLWKRDNIY